MRRPRQRARSPITLDWRLRDDEGNIRPDLWHLRVGIGTTVGKCACGGWVNGEQDGGEDRARCGRCGVSVRVAVPALAGA